jgi:hypothetical protein
MIRLWPFRPRTPTIESLQWLTDLFFAKAGEQRIALRVQPERAFSFAHILTDEELNFARVLVRNAQANGGFYVPDWTQAKSVGDISAGVEVTLPVDVSVSTYGEKALVWESPYRHEIVSVAEDSTGFLEADVIESYAGAKVMPVFEGEAPEGIKVGRLGKSLSEVQIEFILKECADIAASSYPQYRGHDVITDCPITGGSVFEESTGFSLSTLDNVVGLDSYIRGKRFDCSSVSDEVAQVYSGRCL